MCRAELCGVAWDARSTQVLRAYSPQVLRARRREKQPPNRPAGTASRRKFFTSPAGDAVAVLDHLGVEKADVFGLSLGGMVASWMALDHPERIRCLVLASTIPEPSAVSRRGIEKVLSLARCFARPGVGAEIALVRQLLSRPFRDAWPERVAAIERQITAVPAKRRNLVALSLSAARHSTHGAHYPAELPALLLFGELDVLAGESERAELQGELPPKKSTAELKATVRPYLGSEPRAQDVGALLVGLREGHGAGSKTTSVAGSSAPSRPTR